MLDSVSLMSVGQVSVFVGLDKDDPKLDDYMGLSSKYPFVQAFVDYRKSLSQWTNMLARAAIYAYKTPGTFLVSMGDDHEIKSDMWNMKLMVAIKSLDGPGFAFGDDLINGSGLCTSWMVSASVVKEIGWMMLPSCRHMYVDNAIMELGTAANRLAYSPSVKIEHKHPVVKKSVIDQTYLDGSASTNADLLAFRNWHDGPDFGTDVEKLQNMSW